MGEPAVPTGEERKYRRELARECVDVVRNDLASPPLVAALEALKACKSPDEHPKAVSNALDRFDTELFGLAQEITMTRAEVEAVAREMIAEGRREPRNAIAMAYGRRLLFVLGIAP